MIAAAVDVAPIGVQVRDVVVIGSLIFGGTGVVGAVIAMAKFRGESTKLFVDTASGLVVVQSGVVDELKERNAELKTDVATLRGQIATLTARLEASEKWHDEYRDLERKYQTKVDEVTELRRQNGVLKDAIRDQDQRMSELEAEVADLRARARSEDRRAHTVQPVDDDGT